MSRQIVVVRSKTEEDAVVRLQSDAVVRGLTRMGLPAEVLRPGKLSAFRTLAPGSCLLFHYDDFPAGAAIRSEKERGLDVLVGCFGSDIYDFREYVHVHDLASFFLVPTRAHRAVLLQQVYKPVYLLPEAVDPSALEKVSPEKTFPVKESKRLLWFGYPESFEKGMASVMPLVKLRLEDASVDSFTLITGAKGFENRFDVEMLPYSRKTFAQDASRFDYCVLSHLSLDLALNSFIKSPNKLITALLLGLIPLASRTPAYEDLLEEFGLGRFLFESPADLYRKLGTLDPDSDSRQVRDSGIVLALLERFSDENTASAFLEILADMERTPLDPALQVKPAQLTYQVPKVHIIEHLKDLYPSIQRYWKMR